MTTCFYSSNSTTFIMLARFNPLCPAEEVYQSFCRSASDLVISVTHFSNEMGVQPNVFRARELFMML